MPLELVGNIDDAGKLSVYHEHDLKEWIKAHKNKNIVLSIKLKRPKRSNPQNSYYWGVVIPIITDRLNQLGNDFDEDETHDLLKTRFNCKEVEIIDGHYVDVPQSTTRMDTKDFMVYLEKIQQFASQMLSIYIPDPNEQTEINF